MSWRTSRLRCAFVAHVLHMETVSKTKSSVFTCNLQIAAFSKKKTLAYLQFIAILGWQTPFWNDPGLIRLFSFEPIAVPGCGEPKPDNQKQSPPMERTMTIVQIELQAWVARTILKHWNIDSHRRSCHLVFHRLDKQHTGRSQNLGNRECLESYAACLSF